MVLIVVDVDAAMFTCGSELLFFLTAVSCFAKSLENTFDGFSKCNGVGQQHIHDCATFHSCIFENIKNKKKKFFLVFLYIFTQIFFVKNKV